MTQPSPGKVKKPLGQPPTTFKSLAGVLNVEQVQHTEEPIHLLIGKSVENMTQEELKQHIEVLRTLRKAPQSLQSKLTKDELLMDGEYGEPEHKKIRKKFSQTLEDKTAASKSTADAKGKNLADKYS